MTDAQGGNLINSLSALESNNTYRFMLTPFTTYSPCIEFNSESNTRKKKYVIHLAWFGFLADKTPTNTIDTRRV